MSHCSQIDRVLRIVLPLGVAALAAACGSETDATADGGTDTPDARADSPRVAASAETLTYYGVAQPIVEARCTPCHKEDGIAPFSLVGYDALKSYASAVRGVVLDRVMPPLPPDTRDCRALSDARVMPDEEREALIAWIDAGTPEGSPDDAPDEPPPNFVLDEPLGPPSSEADFGVSYESSVTGQDDYRCIVIDPGWSSARILRSVSAVPDNVAMVHHVIMYAQLPAQRDAVDALDADDDGLGYECFGGPGFTGPIPLGGYVPGSQARAFAGGATVTLPAGTRFVMQMHYNFLTTRGLDRSKLAFWEVDKAASVRPSSVILIQPAFTIPAGDAAYNVTATAHIRAGATGGFMTPLGRTTGEPGLAYGAGGHMHTRGKSVRIDVLRVDGSAECLLDIPHWDFDWQGQYRFVEPVQLEDGDDVRITCTWDNSKANQPVVDGKQLDPKPLRWGEGTLDEMCLGSVQMTSR